MMPFVTMPRGVVAGPAFAALAAVPVLMGGTGGGRLAATERGAVMRYVHNAPESPLDRRYLYHWKILETALERTRAKYGAYLLESARFMTEERQRFELTHATGSLTVIYLGTTPSMEKELLPVRIPVDKNLGGYSVFLIRRARQADFAGVKTLDGLRPFTLGLGLGWIDVDILRSNQLRVVTGSSYNGLFEMVENGRFDALLRSVTEVLDEYESRRTRMADVGIEEHLALYYPMPMYFWFSRTDAGRQLAARAEEGMRLMIADGTYDRIFASFHDDKIRRLDLSHRRLVKINNPFLGPETPVQDTRLWFDPQTYRPGRD